METIIKEQNCFECGEALREITLQTIIFVNGFEVHINCARERLQWLSDKGIHHLNQRQVKEARQFNSALNGLDSAEKCSINRCGQIGIQNYDMYNNKPHFFTVILCARHSKETNKELYARKQKVNFDGTYTKINYCTDCKKDIPLEDTHCSKCFDKARKRTKKTRP